jgi:predicted DNA-binding protein (MmcQ/YjbR family)
MVKSPSSLRTHALSVCAEMVGSEMTYPFGDEVAVYKVGGKMFALASLDDEPGRLTLKCEPDHASLLVQSHDEIEPGYHMNKRHWITLTLEERFSRDLIDQLIVESHELVITSLPTRVRRELIAPDQPRHTS